MAPRVAIVATRPETVLDDSSSRELAKILSGIQLIEEAAPRKNCGSFHPDYVVAWKMGDETCRALFCFTCEELKIYKDDSRLAYCDWPKGSASAIGRILLGAFEEPTKAK